LLDVVLVGWYWRRGSSC